MRPSMLLLLAFTAGILHLVSSTFVITTGTAGAITGVAFAGSTLGSLLALKGAAVLGKAFILAGGIGLAGLGDDYHHDPYGYDPYGHHDSYGYDHHDPYDHGHHRRKRQAVEANSKLETYMTAIEAIDNLGCVPKLICDLETKPTYSRNADEVKILDLFDKTAAPTNADEVVTAYDRYKFAAYMGATKKSLSVCRQIYFSCPFPAEQMIDAMRG